MKTKAKSSKSQAPVRTSKTATIPVSSTKQPDARILLQKPDVAARIGITVRTLDRWMQQRRVPFYKIERSVFFEWNEIAAYIKRKFHVSDAPQATHGE